MKKFVAGDSFKLTKNWNIFKKGETVTLFNNKFCVENGIKICVCYGKVNFKMEFIPFTVLQPVSKFSS